jgi:DNA-binding LacI/PurR family transcriptional regulator
LNIKELARHLNVSIGTVSRALNGKRYVDPKTRQRILEAADLLGYAPNQSGRSLRQGTTGMVAMMLPVSGKVAVADTIFMIVLEGLRASFADSGLDLMVLFDDPNDHNFTYLRRVVERRLADGLIIADTQRIDPRIDYLLARKMPFVAFGRSRSGGPYPWVDLDFEGFAEAAVARLTALGHRRIACVTTSDEVNYGFVFADACRDALQRRGISLGPDLMFRVDASEPGGYEFGTRLVAMQDRPTAGILANEIMVIGLYRRMFEAGLCPGRDFSILSFGEEPAARLLSPKATCYAGDFRKLGVRLGEALLAAMPARAKEPGVRLIQELWPLEMVPGESDGARRQEVAVQ